VLNVAVVTGWFAFAKLTEPGPLMVVHVVVKVPPLGNPSSLTTP